MRRFALLLVLVAACSGTPRTATPPPANHVAAKPAPHEPMATLERSACYGWCPVYKLTVYRDGVVEYIGERYVKLIGTASGQLDSAQVQELDHLFEAAGYLKLADSYERASVTDMPSAGTSYTPAGGRTKKIEHYLGDGSAPDALQRVEDGIDKIVHIERWIGTLQEREKLSGR